VAPVADNEPNVDLGRKVQFLSSSGSYPHQPQQVRAIETHMSWVFLTGSRVYKIKKPVRYPFLDFTSLTARRVDCEAELRLNRRLAGEVYRGLLALRLNEKGELSFEPEGEIVEWVIEMDQLPADEMLDIRIQAGRVSTDEAVAIAQKLGQFYAAAKPEIQDGAAYLRHLDEESAVNRELLLRPGWALNTERTQQLLDRVDRLLAAAREPILRRVEAGHIVEGHGDLRPEHVSLTGGLPIIDCLEFDRNMRLLDPYDEVGYLGLECEMLGAGWMRPLMLGVVEDILGGRPEPHLMATYGAFRGMLRARICMAHLLDPEPMEPKRWPDEARRYLALAEEECRKAMG
jgi:uncharacterized protein